MWQLRLEEAEQQLDRAERALRAEVQQAAGLLLGQPRGMLALAEGRDAQALAAFEAAEPLAGLLDQGHPAAAALRLARDDQRAAIAELAPVLDGTAPVANCGWAIQAFLLDAIASGALGDQAAVRTRARARA